MPLLRGCRGPDLPWGAWLSHGAGQSTAEGCRAAPHGPFVVPGSPTAGILKDRGVGLFQRPASRWWRGRGSGVRSPVGAVSQGTIAWAVTVLCLLALVFALPGIFSACCWSSPAFSRGDSHGVHQQLELNGGSSCRWCLFIEAQMDSGAGAPARLNWSSSGVIAPPVCVI